MICHECKKHPDGPHGWWCRSLEAVTRRAFGPKWKAYREGRKPVIECDADCSGVTTEAGEWVCHRHGAVVRKAGRPLLNVQRVYIGPPGTHPGHAPQPADSGDEAVRDA